MPLLKILTNVSNEKIPKDFVNKIIPVLSKCVRKPPETFTCVISGGCHVSFAGNSEEPGAAATLESIGNLGIQENKIITRDISKFLEDELGVNRNRFFISFYDIRGFNIGKGGVTLERPDDLKS